MTDAAALLSLRGLTKRYRKLTAVDDLSFELMPGDLVGFIGPNGAGKSTTMGCIAGSLNPDQGALRVGQLDALANAVEARKLISFVPQHLELFDHLTGLEYLQLIGALRGLDDATRDAQIDELMAMAELDHARHRLLKEYSGGMARKAAICGALLGPPRVLLLDESFVGLDPESTFRLRERLQRFCDEGGAILLSSHILEMLEHVCTRIIMIVGGKLVLDAPMDTLRPELQAEGGLTARYMRLAGKL